MASPSVPAPNYNNRNTKPKRPRARRPKTTVPNLEPSPNTTTTTPPPPPSSKPKPHAFKHPTSSVKSALASLKRQTSLDALTRSLANDLITSKKECIICFDAIRPKHRIWSCLTCYTPVHLTCLTQWAKSTTGSASVRCPACNTDQPTHNFSYLCFCLKTTNPHLDRWSVPHSCTLPCQKLLACSQHVCTVPCHPGPCPPCSVTVTVKCPGMHVSKQAICSSDAALTPLLCTSICGRPLACQSHECSLPCHDGPCLPCSLSVPVPCACGRADPILVTCGSDIAMAKTWTCEDECGFQFTCKHTCPQKCCTGPHSACPFLPSFHNTCPCGKTNLNRTSCWDPVDVPCGKACGTPLPCGHKCSKQCHPKSSPCQCSGLVDVTCRCGLVSTAIPCTTWIELLHDQIPFTCDTLCNTILTCLVKGHKCKSVCCPANPKTLSIVQSKVVPKGRRNNRHSGRSAVANTGWQSFEDAVSSPSIPRDQELLFHSCPRPCTKLLACGTHTCPRTCHTGPCPPCLEASFDEMHCACGQSSIIPPVPCGTVSVPCPYPCQRPQECGHAVVTQHVCHPDSEPCPPCPILVPKPCACGKSAVPSRCSAEANLRKCGSKCAMPLECGHTCSSGCHNLQVSACVCRQKCGRRRTSTCGHVCQLDCHYPAPCSEMGGCTEKVKRQCECGRIVLMKPCVPNTNTVPLECTESCRVAIRNHNLALALSVDPDHVSPATIEYSPELLCFCKQNNELVRLVESTLTELVYELEMNPDQRLATSRLRSMKSAARQCVYQVAEIWNVGAQSFDLEPKRWVQLTAKQGVARMPRLLINDAVLAFELQSVQLAHDAVDLLPLDKHAKSGASDLKNGLFIAETLLLPSEMELYVGMYFEDIPFIFVEYTPCGCDPHGHLIYNVVVEVAPNSDMSMIAKNDLIQSVCDPLRTLLVDICKASNVSAHTLNNHGQVVDSGFVHSYRHKRDFVPPSGGDAKAIIANPRSGQVAWTNDNVFAVLDRT